MRYLFIALLLCGCGSSTSGGGMDMSGAVGDMTPTVDASLQGLGTMCTMASQCQSNTCAPYKMGAYKLCTLPCTALMAAPQCTAPSDGTCNGMGYCKFPGM
jgi:hypothetical protein